MIFDKPPYRWERKRKVYKSVRQLKETSEEEKLSRLFFTLLAMARDKISLFDPDNIPEESPKATYYFDAYRIFCKEAYNRELLLQVLEREKKRLGQAPNVLIAGVGMCWLREFGSFHSGCRTRYGMRVDNRRSVLIYDGIAWLFALEVDGKPLNTVAINWEGDVICSTGCVLEYSDPDMPYHGLYTPYNLLTWALGPGLYDSERINFDEFEARNRRIATLGKILDNVRVRGSAKRVGRDLFGNVLAFIDGKWRVISRGVRLYVVDAPVEMLPEYADELLEKVL